MGSPSPGSTLAILLGGSDFPRARSFIASLAFKKSAAGVRDYFLSEDGFRLPPENLLDLFDSTDPASILDQKITTFLEMSSTRLSAANSSPTDILVYYVGHGGFGSNGADYFLAIRDTNEGNELFSSIAIKSLAGRLKTSARHLRRYLILDCCFSGAAYAAFQAGPVEVAAQQTLDEFPEKGTALLCASGPREPAKAPANLECTMFSNALLDVLRKGSVDDPEWFTLEQLGDKVRGLIREKFQDEAVRPQVLSPDQTKGSLTRLPLFPNPALRQRRILASLQDIEAGLGVTRDGQRKLESQLGEVLRRVEKLESNTSPNEFPVARAVPGWPDGPKLKFGLTESQWDAVPAVVKEEIYDYLSHWKVGVCWILVCAFVCIWSWVEMLIQVNTTPSRIVFTLCILMTAISCSFTIKDIVRPDHDLKAGPYVDSKQAWASYDIVINARRQGRVKLVPGVEVHRRALAISSLVYLITLICAILSRAGYLGILR